MSKIFPPQPFASENAHVPSMEKYEEIYQSSIADPEKFWAENKIHYHIYFSFISSLCMCSFWRGMDGVLIEIIYELS